MKFKDDSCGWRDLVIGDVEGDHLQVSIETESGRDPFIAVRAEGRYAAYDLSRKQLLQLAYKILKELSK